MARDPVANRRRNRIDTEKQAKSVDARAKAKETADKEASRKKSDPMASSVDAITERATAKYKKQNVDSFSELAPKRERKIVSVKPDSKNDPMSSSVDAINQKALSRVKKPAAKTEDKPASSSAPKKAKESMVASMGRAYDKSLMDRMSKKDSDSKPAEKKMSFGAAFKAARKAGKKEFTWNGKKYHTKTKDEQIAQEKFSGGGYKTKKANMGMLNSKKPRTGTMDYRKGGLFR